MKKSLILLAFLGSAICAHAQFHTGPYYSVTVLPLNRSIKIEPRLQDIKQQVNLGWHREKWINESFFRVWNIHAESIKGKFSQQYERDFYKFNGIRDGDFGMYIAQTNFNLGKPLFNGEIDDPFLWYVVGGVGVSYLNYYGENFYHLPGAKYATYTKIEGNKMLPNFNLGIGMETRMGRRWYLNLLANAEYTVQPRLVISARLLRKKPLSGGFWRQFFGAFAQ